MSVQRAISIVRELTPRQATPADSPDVVKAAQEVLTQGLDLLIQLNDRSYSQRVAPPFQASIGQHYRHVLEHFQSLVWGLKPGEINYDARERNPRIENEVGYASIVTCELLGAFKRITHETLGDSCAVIVSVGYGSSSPSRLESNVGRELAYCAGHAIHHYAIIRLLCSEVGVDVPAGFGFAPSTLKHMSTQAAD